MIALLRKVRQQLVSGNKVTQYILYAVGEIFLVVVGILIALQINNSNDVRKERDKELRYLKNINADLLVNISQIDQFIATRDKGLGSANIVLEHFEGKPVTDLDALNTHSMNVYSWQRFYPINYTFEELTNSGNLALISNDSIKSMLLTLESHYKQLKAEEDHLRYDMEVTIYDPLFSFINLNPLVKRERGLNVPLTPDIFEPFFKSQKLKNGFVLVDIEFKIMNRQLKEIKQKSEMLIGMIQRELARG